MIKTRNTYKIRGGIIVILTALVFLTTLTYTPTNAFAACCVGCLNADCPQAPPLIVSAHEAGRTEAKTIITNAFTAHKDWIVKGWLEPRWAPALQGITRFLSAVGYKQVYMYGTLLDGKHYAETVRDMQELQFQAHKDYQPSTTLCTYGTALRTMAHTESAAKATSLGISTRQLARHTGKAGTGGASSSSKDKLNRWNQFKKYYCDPQDNYWRAGIPNTGLSQPEICGNGSGNTDRINGDIDYTRAVENKGTIDITASGWDHASEQQTDILALGNNLYGHNVLSRNLSQNNLKNADLQNLYLQLRSIAAKRSVAELSFNSIVGLKSMGTSDDATKTNLYLGRLLSELGIPEDEVVTYLGLDPDKPYIGEDGAQASYYSVLEILAKKIYQNPKFFGELYDTPANTKRKSAALKAIELMLDRAIFESELRQEMAMSVLLSSRMEAQANKANKNLGVLYNAAE